MPTLWARIAAVARECGRPSAQCACAKGAFACCLTDSPCREVITPLARGRMRPVETAVGIILRVHRKVIKVRAFIIDFQDERARAAQIRRQ